MARLNIERQKELEPLRIKYVIGKLNELGIDYSIKDEHTIEIFYNRNKILFYPYSGYFSGKGVKSGRGLNRLLFQLKSNKSK